MANASICRKFDSSKRWVDVPRFEGIYAVSDVGDVMRVSPGAGRAKVGAILSFARNPKGYKHVGLCKNGKSETTYIHVLVCGAFHGPKPTPTHQAAHRNDDKDNNSEANLYWATPLENHRDRRRNGGILQGSQVGKATLKEEDVLGMFEMRAKGVTQSRIASKYGVAGHTVSRILAGKRWGHMGLHNSSGVASHGE